MTAIYTLSDIGMTTIYTLSDPDSGRVMYVGKSVNPASRYKVHLSDADCGVNSPKCKWIRRLGDAGKKPVLTVIDHVDEDGDWEKVEKQWIRHYAEINPGLVNVTHNPNRLQWTANETQCGLKILSTDGFRKKWSNSLKEALSSPIVISVRGTATHVIMSLERYEELKRKKLEAQKANQSA